MSEKTKEFPSIKSAGKTHTVICDVCGKEFDTVSAVAKRHPVIYKGKLFDCKRLGGLRRVKAWHKRNPGWNDKYNKKRCQGTTRTGKLPELKRQQQTILPIRKCQKIPAEQWQYLTFEK